MMPSTSAGARSLSGLLVITKAAFPRIKVRDILWKSCLTGLNGFYGNGLIVGGFNGFYGNGLIVGGFNGFCRKILIVAIS